MSRCDSNSGARPVPKIRKEYISGTFRNERSGTSVENMLENRKEHIGTHAESCRIKHNMPIMPGKWNIWSFLGQKLFLGFKKSEFQIF